MAGIIRFGSFEADLASGELRKRGLRVKLREKSFELLGLLLEHPGEVVRREDLRARLWPPDIFVDFDNNLYAALRTLRRALGDSASRPKFVETLPRRGYRFIGPVVEQRREPRRGNLRLAVLPLQNIGDAAEDYFCDGMTEELITQLAALAPERLRILARTTTMHYKSTRKSAGRIGRELGVEYVLEGSVRRGGDHVRVSAQLIRTDDETHVWARSYERERCDVLMMQADVARAVAHEIEVAISPAGLQRLERAGTIDPFTYDAYTRGLYQFNRFSPIGLREALERFREALDRDPQYAPAWAKSAMAYAFSGVWGYAPQREVFSEAETAAGRALALDASLGEAHNALALVKWLRDWDLSACRRGFEHALALNANDATAHWGLAIYFGAMVEDQQRARAEAQQALELDPLSVAIRSNMAWLPYWRREYDQAIAESRHVLEMDETCLQASYVLGLAACAARRFDVAIAALETCVARHGDPTSLGYLGMVYGFAGAAGKASGVLCRLKEMASVGAVRALDCARVCVGLRATEEALDWLDNAYAARDPQLLWLRVTPFYDPLRSLPRFQRGVDRLGLPPRP